MAKHLLIAVIVIWVLSVVLRLIGGVSNLIGLVFIIIVFAGIMAPRTLGGDRRGERP